MNKILSPEQGSWADTVSDRSPGWIRREIEKYKGEKLSRALNRISSDPVVQQAHLLHAILTVMMERITELEGERSRDLERIDVLESAVNLLLAERENHEAS